MKGKIDKIWQNETADGRRYDVLQIGGEKYSLWDEKYFDKIQEGQMLEFEFRESGDFRNITEIYESPRQETSDRKDYAQERLTKIIKMSCLKSASEVLSGSKIPYTDRAGKAIEIARRFEKYIHNEEPDEDTLNPQETSDE
jgi:hypothetical protein